MNLTANALRVLQSRYLLQNAAGQIKETPEQLFRRVAVAIAAAEKLYGDPNEVMVWQNRFYQVMSNLDFLPNSPTLMNAGTTLNQLSACFVLPVGDSLNSIFTTLKDAMLIQQSGGGTGFNFSKIRPRGNFIDSTGGQASGPVTFMNVYNASTGSIKQGGKRRGANMGILNADHPDIEEFIESKRDENALVNFNISVGVTNQFMLAVESNAPWKLKHPITGETQREVPARYLWEKIILMAWQTGDPGIVFLDHINKTQPTPALGSIDCTNPCGEVPLLPYEACNLGSVNLGNFYDRTKGVVDWVRLESVVRTGIRFLDNVISVNTYIIPQTAEVVNGNRKIGLGVMGWADLLIKMGIAYEDPEAITLAHNLMSFISEVSIDESNKLAVARGAFANWKQSIYYPLLTLRNATRTCIAPTGTISIIAGASSSIEPLFALAFKREHVLNNETLEEVNPLFVEVLKKHNLYTENTLKLLYRSGNANEIGELPDDIKRLFKTALEISPQTHLQHQEAFQKFTDNAVSKTINLPHNATREDVENICYQAWKRNVKGITVFRTGCKSQQVIQPGMYYETGCQVCVD